MYLQLILISHIFLICNYYYLLFFVIVYFLLFFCDFIIFYFCDIFDFSCTWRNFFTSLKFFYGVAVTSAGLSPPFLPHSCPAKARARWNESEREPLKASEDGMRQTTR